MGLPRSTYYDAPVATADEAEIVARIEAICEEFEAYGYRRVGAALRHQGIIVNSKKVRRLMREHDLQPRRRKRFVATTDSDHDGPIFPNLAKDVTADAPNQLWVADITYVAIAVGFVYVAVILDAWSRRVVGYAISRSIDARLTIAALKAAIRSRRPVPPINSVRRKNPDLSGGPIAFVTRTRSCFTAFSRTFAVAPCDSSRSSRLVINWTSFGATSEASRWSAQNTRISVPDGIYRRDRHADASSVHVATERN